MNEMLTVFQATLGGLGVLIASFLWSFGGRSGTSLAWRRFGSSLVMATCVMLLFLWRDLWSWWLFLLPPIMVAGASFGYGGHDIWEKVVKRAIFVFANALSAFVILVIYGPDMIGILICQLLCGLATVILGVTNPVKAPAEEFLIATMLYFFYVAYPFI